MSHSRNEENMTPFDGRTWECKKCNNVFDLLDAYDYRCPECRTQVKKNEVIKRAVKTKCLFQKPIFVPDYTGLGCGLTGVGTTRVFQGMDWGTSAKIIHACDIDVCPIYQTWKIQRERDV